MSAERPDGADQDPARFDPWSGHQYGGARFFAASTVIHVVLLLVFAGISLTVFRSVERIEVQIIDGPGADVGGAPSLDDYAGLLEVTRAPRQTTQRPQGPVVRHIEAPRAPSLPDVGPKRGRGTELSGAALPLGAGGIGRLGGSFGDYVGGLRKTGLDLVLVIDTTESMQFVIAEVKRHAESLVRSIQRMVPTSRIGIVAYRDHGDEYVVKWSDLSFRTDKLTSFIGTLSAAGGGDWEEAVLAGVEAAITELSWRRKSKKIIVLIGGSPPHPGDVEPLTALVRAFHADGGTLSTIDVTDHLHLEFHRAMWRSLHGDKPFSPPPKADFYQQVTTLYGELASAGGGEMIQLADDRKLTRDVLVLTFGSRWRLEMAKHLEELS